LGSAHIGVGESASIIDEVKDALVMPHYNGKVYVEVEQTQADLSEIVQQQLHDYVSIICSMYIDHPFHNVSVDCPVSCAVLPFFHQDGSLKSLQIFLLPYYSTSTPQTWQ
jgi:hypothetical protein